MSSNRQTRLLIAGIVTDDPSGPSIYRRTFIQSLSAYGFEDLSLFLFAFKHSRAGVEESERIGVNYLEICEFESHPYTEDRFDAWMKCVTQRSPNIAYLDSIRQIWYSVPFLRKKGIVSIGVLHSDDGYHHSLMRDAIVHGFVPDIVVAVSRHLFKAWENILPKETRLLFLPCGIEMPQERARFNDEFELVYVGRIEEEQKCILELAELLIQATQRNIGIRASIYGTGRAVAKLTRLLSERGNHRVTYRGKLPHERLYETLAKTQAFVLWSSYEGTPIALLEAMALGLVSICRRTVSGIPDLLGDGSCGYMVDTPDQFYRSVEKIYSDPARWEALSSAAIGRAKLFEVKAATETLLKAALEILANREARPEPNGDIRFSLPPLGGWFDGRDLRRPRWPFSLLGYLRMRVAAWKRKCSRRIPN